MNPFKIDGIVDGADYMPRKESDELLKYHKAGRNVLIRGPRRTGKSSLVVNTFKNVKCLFIRVDFWVFFDEFQSLLDLSDSDPFFALWISNSVD